MTPRNVSAVENAGEHSAYKRTANWLVILVGVWLSAFSTMAIGQSVPDYSVNCSTSGCHDGYIKAASVHAPVEAGDCDACHDALEGKSHKFELSLEPKSLCVDCHDDEFTGEVEHKPVSAGECTACHSPHASQQPHLLLGSVKDVCNKCHKTVTDGRKTLHGPVAEGDCTSCHAPHGSDTFRMLTDEFPSRFYASYDEDRYALCFGCHDAEVFEDEMTEDGTEFRNGEHNLHFLHVNKSVKGRSCIACHDPHGSNQLSHIAESVPFGQWRLPIRYTKTDTGGSCSPGCHSPYQYDRETPSENRKALLPNITVPNKK